MKYCNFYLKKDRGILEIEFDRGHSSKKCPVLFKVTMPGTNDDSIAFNASF